MRGKVAIYRQSPLRLNCLALRLPRRFGMSAIRGVCSFPQLDFPLSRKETGRCRRPCRNWLPGCDWPTRRRRGNCPGRNRVDKSLLSDSCRRFPNCTAWHRLARARWCLACSTHCPTIPIGRPRAGAFADQDGVACPVRDGAVVDFQAELQLGIINDDAVVGRRRVGIDSDVPRETIGGRAVIWSARSAGRPKSRTESCTLRLPCST